MQKSEQINELAQALAKAQSKIIGAIADSKNPFYKSTYANLESVWTAIRGPLTENGLSVVQTPEAKENGVLLETTILHISGQWISGMMFMPAEKLDPQTFGKLVTYIRRYSLTAMIGVPQIDDDAESAMKRPSDPDPSQHGPSYDEEGDHMPLGLYVMQGGQGKGRSLKSSKLNDLKNYLNWLTNDCKAPMAAHKMDKQMIKSYLNSDESIG